MDTIDILGFVAGAIIIISLLPQLREIIKNKSSENISITTYVMLFISQILWIIYAFNKNDLQLIITNIFSGFITFFIISFSLYYKNKNTRDYQPLF